jgi:hypothetical protein
MDVNGSLSSDDCIFLSVVGVSVIILPKRPDVDRN